MEGAKKERWMEVAQKVTIEQDPTKLLQLVRELNDLLEEKEKRLGIVPPEKLS